MHISAIVCFALAFFFYSFAWGAVASGLAIIGVFFEITAWIIWFSTDKDTKT
jgi:asparagine N-glycosylation enzyme membrane subunit Stt3